MTQLKEFSKTNRVGGYDYFGPDGNGVRVYPDGKFRGFLEPNL